MLRTSDFRTPPECHPAGPYSVEDDGLISVEKNAVVNVPAHGSREHDLLQVASLLQQVVDRVSVRDAYHILLDDGTVVQNFGNVVAGCPDQLNSPRECLMVRFGADERRQERAVDIDDAVRVA